MKHISTIIESLRKELFICPHCGGHMLGDGYTTVLHCENTDPFGYEPDAKPLFCSSTDNKQ